MKKSYFESYLKKDNKKDMNTFSPSNFAVFDCGAQSEALFQWIELLVFLFASQNILRGYEESMGVLIGLGKLKE